MHIDQYSGKVLADMMAGLRFSTQSCRDGELLYTWVNTGLPNQLLMLFACLIVITLCVSGAVMWWQRRPKQPGAIGAPALPPMCSSGGAVGNRCCSGYCFPLVGLSLVIYCC